ncbi:hypothetical protein D917_09472 [Trichinella nativa]|uniref:Uncharacterized protein n=1 Tax=Trichinella nativa TaxID=6335 RepID=A0A1Y3EFF1_9BILA|nr:hypothetical protein D917_09472 [Trichinella nativa]
MKQKKQQQRAQAEATSTSQAQHALCSSSTTPTSACIQLSESCPSSSHRYLVNVYCVYCAKSFANVNKIIICNLLLKCSVDEVLMNKLRSWESVYLSISINTVRFYVQNSQAEPKVRLVDAILPMLKDEVINVFYDHILQPRQLLWTVGKIVSNQLVAICQSGRFISAMQKFQLIVPDQTARSKSRARVCKAKL